MNSGGKRIKTAVSLAIGTTLFGFLLSGTGLTPPVKREINVSARQYAYSPEKIEVNLGDTLIISLKSEDVTHGFYLEGYGLRAYTRAQFPHFWVQSQDDPEEYEKVESISIIATKSGKFRYRCSITCGSMHPFMQGELIVKPNRVYGASMGLIIGLFFAFVILFKPIAKESVIAELQSERSIQ